MGVWWGAFFWGFYGGFFKKMEKDYRLVIMSKRFLFLLVLFFSGFIYADVKFQLEPYFAWSNGIHGEHLFYTTGKRCSYLRWEESSIITLGLEANTKINKFGILLNAEFGIPAKNGTMEDSDWIYTSEYPDGLKTTYSESEITCTKKINTEISFSYDFDIKNRFTISPIIQAQYSYIFFEAKNGYGWYGSYKYSYTGTNVAWDSGYARFFSKLYGIDLLRHTFYSWTGLKMLFKISDRFDIDFSLYLSPFTYTFTEDYHHGSDGGSKMQEPLYSNFNRFKTDINVLYKINNFLTIRTGFYFLYGKTDKGETFTDYYTNSFAKSSQESAADIINFRIKAGCIFYIK